MGQEDEPSQALEQSICVGIRSNSKSQMGTGKFEDLAAENFSLSINSPCIPSIFTYFALRNSNFQAVTAESIEIRRE
jgi:hypothetical protein